MVMEILKAQSGSDYPSVMHLPISHKLESRQIVAIFFPCKTKLIKRNYNIVIQ